MGAIPPTALLLVKDDTVIGKFSNYAEIAMYLGVGIDDEGNIIFDGKKCNPSYGLEPRSGGYTKIEAVIDWVKNYMNEQIKDYSIYRYLTY